MTSQPITGAPCDTSHPFPAPEVGRWIDSMEYGETERAIPTMYDRDTLPTWRLLAAYAWNAPCYDTHIIDVIADPILTTHLIASAALASDPDATDMITRLGFDQAGAGAVFAELRNGGLAKARQLVNAMHPNTRRTAVQECLAHLNHGVTALKLDAGARFTGQG